MGSNIVARLSHEDSVGRVIIERQIQLGGIEEMISAAPRLVEAVVLRRRGGGAPAPAGYVAGGVEALRLTRARLRVEVRVDRPFFGLGNRDMMPVSLGLSLTVPAPLG